MRLSLNWVNEFLSETLTKEEVESNLLSVGIEVDSVEYAAKGFDDVVLAQVVDFEQHPNADRLRLCKVNDGVEEHQIVCGATNFEKGDYVSLARIGALLPNGLKIKKSKIRDVASFGMLCSLEELELSSESEGIVCFKEKPAALGTSMAEVLDVDDWIFTLELTPNRGDCLSVVGLARELAAAKGLSLKVSDTLDSSTSGANQFFEVKIPNLVKRYALNQLEDINNKVQSSLKVKNRLKMSGMRPLNPLVDLTNYIMMERGQPMHAFDAEKIKGVIQVRLAKDGEKILCLDSVERKLGSNDIVVADEEGPLAIAGIIGGQRASVGESTKSAFIESAYFDPTAIRKTAKRLKLSTDSSYRFERTVDIQSTQKALALFIELANKALGSHVSEKESFSADAYKPGKIVLKSQTLSRILGKNIPEAGDYLSRLGFLVHKLDDSWSVESLSRRPDITREIDLVEEVARIHGYDAFEAKLPPAEGLPKPNVNNTYDLVQELKKVVVSKGFSECYNYSFDDKETSQAFGSSDLKPIEISNPINKEFEVMRSSLLPGLLRNVSFNMSRQAKSLRLFEVGKTFLNASGNNSLYKETLNIAFVWAGFASQGTWNEKEKLVNFFDLKGMVESLCSSEYKKDLRFLPSLEDGMILNPAKSAKVFYKDQELGFIGELHPSCAKKFGIKSVVQVCELNDGFVKLTQMSQHKKYEKISVYPSVQRDFSFLLEDKVNSSDVLEAISLVKIPVLQSINFFDRFEGKGVPEGHYSLSFSAIFSSKNKTLVDKEVEKFSNKIVAQMENKFSAKLR